MSLFKGQLTYARYFVDPDESEPLESGFAERFLETLAARPFVPLDPEEDVRERVGWCRVGEPFETSFGHGDLFWNGHLVLGFRVDRWVVPSSLVKAKTRQAEASYLAKKGRERASKKEKAELKELVTRKLRRQLAPSTRSVDLALSLDDGIARFFSHSAALGGAMCELFRSTFGLRLVPEAPYTTAARIGLDALVGTKRGDALWDALEPTDLTNANALGSRGGR
ncbi:MAG: recombination-associated protein RdgC [Deltaproteobacteria bacterium]|nr:recombination-associated protein RdgC [Deltaproteobacteria bacterium]